VEASCGPRDALACDLALGVSRSRLRGGNGSGDGDRDGLASWEQVPWAILRADLNFTFKLLAHMASSLMIPSVISSPQRAGADASLDYPTRDLKACWRP